MQGERFYRTKILYSIWKFFIWIPLITLVNPGTLLTLIALSSGAERGIEPFFVLAIVFGAVSGLFLVYRIFIGQTVAVLGDEAITFTPPFFLEYKLSIEWKDMRGFVLKELEPTFLTKLLKQNTARSIQFVTDDPKVNKKHSFIYTLSTMQTVFLQHSVQEFLI